MVPSPAASHAPSRSPAPPVPLGDDLAALPASKQVAGHARALLVPRQPLQPLHRNARRPVNSPRALPGDCRRRICVLAEVRGNEHGGAEAGWANAAAETQPRVVDQNEATDGASNARPRDGRTPRRTRPEVGSPLVLPGGSPRRPV